MCVPMQKPQTIICVVYNHVSLVVVEFSTKSFHFCRWRGEGERWGEEGEVSTSIMIISLLEVYYWYYHYSHCCYSCDYYYYYYCSCYYHYYLYTWRKRSGNPSTLAPNWAPWGGLGPISLRAGTCRDTCQHVKNQPGQVEIQRLPWEGGGGSRESWNPHDLQYQLNDSMSCTEDLKSSTTCNSL